MKAILKYIAQLLADRNGMPSAKRHACALFGITAVILAFFGYGAEIVAIFLAATVGENITTLFERGKR
jgi:hypothetical protein